jgi:hypothetical protein
MSALPQVFLEYGNRIQSSLPIGSSELVAVATAPKGNPEIVCLSVKGCQTVKAFRTVWHW